jgi:hypothetical protein
MTVPSRISEATARCLASVNAGTLRFEAPIEVSKPRRLTPAADDERASSAHRSLHERADLSSSAAVSSFSANEVGHMAPSSTFALSLKPNVAYLDLNFCAL